MVHERLDALLHRDGVDDAFALDALQAGLDHLPLGGVDHDRHARDVRLTGDQVEEAHHGRFGVEHALVHVDVDDLRAVFHLLAGHVQRFAVLLFFDQALELGRAGDVGALAHVHEQAELRSMVNGSRPDRRQATGISGSGRGGTPSTALAMAAMCSGVVPQQPPTMLRKPGSRPLADLRRHGGGIEVVFAEGVRQTGVRVGGDVAFGDARQLLHVLAQFVRAQRAVQAEGERLGVAQRVIEGFGGLAGQGTAGGVGDGAGNHDRQRQRPAPRTPLSPRRSRPWR